MKIKQWMVRQYDSENQPISSVAFKTEKQALRALAKLEKKFPMRVYRAVTFGQA